jgi:acetylglutamate kinase
MTVAEARGLIESGVASGGMIPKLENAIHAVAPGSRPWSFWTAAVRTPCWSN